MPNIVIMPASVRTLIAVLIVANLSPVRAAPAPQIPCEDAVKRFDGYSCVQKEPVGVGSMATVYLVKEEKFTRVLRIVNVENELDRKKTEQEVELFQMFLGHRNIIRFIEYKEDAGHFYELMEYGSQGTLDKFQLEHPAFFETHKQLIAFFRKIVKGVQFMHSKGYIHADLKPQNVVVTETFEPKIIDFNLAIPKGEVSTYRGTLGYADPSFLIDKSPMVELEYDEYNDVYSLGVILYELTHGKGQLPFDGFYEADILVQLGRHRFTIKKGTHTHLARIIHSCLVISKKWRLSVDELLKELDRADRIPENDKLTEDVYLYNDAGLPEWMKPIKRKAFTRKIMYTYTLICFMLLIVMSMSFYIYRLGRKRDVVQNLEEVGKPLHL